jgi:hypothetical protein
LVIELRIKTDATSLELIAYMNKLQNSPWHAEKRQAGGYSVYHKKTAKEGREGNIRLRRTRKTEDGHRMIYATAVGVDEVEMCSNFLKWLLTHFREKMLKITIQ